MGDLNQRLNHSGFGFDLAPIRLWSGPERANGPILFRWDLLSACWIWGVTASKKTKSLATKCSLTGSKRPGAKKKARSKVPQQRSNVVWPNKRRHNQISPFVSIFSRSLAALKGNSELLIECCYCGSHCHCTAIHISALSLHPFCIHRHPFDLVQPQQKKKKKVPSFLHNNWSGMLKM